MMRMNGAGGAGRSVGEIRRGWAEGNTIVLKSWGQWVARARERLCLCVPFLVCAPGGNEGRLGNAHGAGGKTLGEGASVSEGNRTVTHTEISTAARTPLARPEGGECSACGLEKVGFSQHKTEGGRKMGWTGEQSTFLRRRRPRN